MAEDRELYEAAIQLIETRLANASWKTAAAIRLSDGTVLTGIGLANFNSAAGFCAEVGPLAQAYTEDRTVVASICVNRSDDREADLVLAPAASAKSASHSGGRTSRSASPTQPCRWGGPRAA